MATLSQDLTKPFNEAEGAAKDVASQVQSYAQDKAEAWGAQAGQSASQANKSLNKFYSAGKSYVRRNPGQGVLFAAAVGLLAGGLIGMGWKSRR